MLRTGVQAAAARRQARQLGRARPRRWRDAEHGRGSARAQAAPPVERAVSVAPQLLIRDAGPQATAALRTLEKHLSYPSRWSPSLQPDAFSLHPYASRRHENVVSHAAAVLDLEPANAYDRARRTCGALQGGRLWATSGALSRTSRCESHPNPSRARTRARPLIQA